MLRFVAIIAYWAGLDCLFYWLNRRAKRIITFHNVMPDELQSIASIGVSESVTDFSAKLNEMAKHFSFSADLSDEKTVTITFDDGTINEYEVAGEILRERNIPAVLFVAGDIIDATPDKTLVTDKLLLWCNFAPDEMVEKVFGAKVARGVLWVKYVQPAYRRDWQNRGRNFLAELESVYSIKEIVKSLPHEWVRLRLSGVTQEQIETLRSRGWKIGWHTKSHYPLGMLDNDAKREELSSSPEYRSVVLSYPYGDIGSIGVESLKLVEKLGYPGAVSNDPNLSPYQGKFFAQRMALSADKYQLHLVLSGLKYFLKFRKLLPKNVIGLNQ